MKLTDQFHNELVNDIVPAVESKYSTYAEDVTHEAIVASRDHRGFGGFSMDSVNTWCTFRYALDCFRYFIPMSGNYGTNDGIASYKTMQARIDAIKGNGTDAEIEIFRGLSHGFGLGTGTVAEGWLDNAVSFWERNMK